MDFTGILEYSDKRSNQMQGSERMLVIQAKLMADSTNDADL